MAKAVNQTEDVIVAEVAEAVVPAARSSRPALWRYFLPVVLCVCAIVGIGWSCGLGLNLIQENLRVARSIRAGEGFAHPFDNPTGPTAWVPPLLPLFLAGVLELSNGSSIVVTRTIIVLQEVALAVTLILVLLLARRSTRWIGPELAAAVFFLMVLAHFRLCFLTAAIDCGVIMITMDLILAGLCWAKPLADWKKAAAWGIFGGLAGLVNPVPGFVWGGMTIVMALRERAWSRLAVTLFAAVLALAPWTIRNYLVFGRLIPIKSNLVYELYQSQVLAPTGMAHGWSRHPGSPSTPEGRVYRQLGEAEYLDRKREQLWQAIRDNPEEFIDRVAHRFLGATLVYEPFNQQEARHPWVVRLTPIIHALPFLAFVVLVFRGVVGGLSWERWAAVGVYVLFMTPYIIISYYDRYVMPALGVKTLLVVWALDEFFDVLARLAGNAAKRKGPEKS
jgi:hypothetical protein